MNTQDKRIGDAALRHLCVGKQVVGARWPVGFFIEIEAVNRLPLAGDLLLTVESPWTVFPARPDRFPQRAEDLPELSLEERVVALARLKGQEIIDATLGEEHAHLILTFASGRVFFLNGYHERYECWTLSSVDDLIDGYNWTIVATPGGGVALWVPDSLR